MITCTWCNLSEADKKFLLYESEYWSAFLSDKQDYIGRCILVLKRHSGSLTELTYDEWDDLFVHVKKLEECLKAVFGADLCNWSCLMNDSYKDDKPDPHLHIHVRTRYKSPVMINGKTYSDEEFGHHYDNHKQDKLTEPEKEEVFQIIKNHFNDV